MEDNFKEAEKLYTKTVVCFKDWLYKYSSKTDRINTNLRNKPVYNLSEQDYYKSIIDFIAGMTDNFAMDIYNEIISFLNRNFKW